jgi:hypothetical protein
MSPERRNPQPTAIGYNRGMRASRGSSTRSRAGRALCLSVDGTDPAPSLLAQLRTPGRVVPQSQCPTADLPRLRIHGYRSRGGSGSGTITFERAPDAGSTPVVDTYEVHRGERGWRVIELL